MSRPIAENFAPGQGASLIEYIHWDRDESRNPAHDDARRLARRAGVSLYFVDRLLMIAYRWALGYRAPRENISRAHVDRVMAIVDSYR